MIQTRVQRRDEIIKLCLKGLSQSAVADMCGVTRQAVNSVIVRARRESMEKLGMTSESKARQVINGVVGDDLDTYGYPADKFVDMVCQVEIELECYRRLRFEKGFKTGHDLAFHMERAIRLGLPEKSKHGRGFIVSPWTSKRIRAWCEHEYQTWWGSTSVGKTHDAAAIVLIHCLSMPSNTMVSVASTSLNMTKRRIFGKILGILRLWNAHAKAQGREPALAKDPLQLGPAISRRVDKADQQNRNVARPAVWLNAEPDVTDNVSAVLLGQRRVKRRNIRVKFIVHAHNFLAYFKHHASLGISLAST